MRTPSGIPKLTLVGVSDFDIFFFEEIKMFLNCEMLLSGGLFFLFTMWAEFADESLSDDKLERRGEEVTFNSHIHESR